jgi:hypothetical protein
VSVFRPNRYQEMATSTVDPRRERAFSQLPSELESSIALARMGIDVPPGSKASVRGVLSALDVLSGATAGRVSRRAFMVEPHPRLRGMRPVDVLAEEDGHERIWTAVRHTTANPH